MLHNWWVRAIAVIVLGLAALLVIRLHSASGATAAIEGAARGRVLAEAWCSECHAIDKFAIPIERRAPAFVAIASQRSTTPLSIKVFLQSSHEPMPNFILKKQDIEDITAYILSLRL